MNSNVDNKSAIRLGAAASLVLTFALIVTRIVNILFFYDSDIGYYKSGAVLPTVMNLLFIVGLLFFAVLCFIINKKSDDTADFSASARPKLLYLAAALLLAIEALGMITRSTSTPLDMLIGVCAIVSSAYFALRPFKKAASYIAILSFAPTVLCVLILARTYFDMTVPMNSPNKTLIHITCVACMLGFLAQTRAFADRKRKKTYFLFLFSALFFTGASSVPSIILYCSNNFDNSYIKFDAILLALFIYLVANTVSLCLNDTSDDTTQNEVIKEENNT